MRRNHFLIFSCHSGEANSSLKHLPTTSIIIETAVEAPGEAPSKTDNDPSAVVITSVPNSSIPPSFLSFDNLDVDRLFQLSNP
jgi:hypothetical protein